MSKDYHRRYRAMLDYIGIKNPKVTEITGLDYSTVRKATSISGEFSRWAKFTVWVFEFMLEKIGSNECNYDTEKEYGKAKGAIFIHHKDPLNPDVVLRPYVEHKPKDNE